MRAKVFVLFALLGAVALILGPADGLSQPGSKGSSKSGGYSKGGGSGSSDRSGPGSPGGGPGPGSSRDPSQFFDFLAKGKDVLVRAEMDPRMHRMFDSMADKLGVTNGEITREQFMSASDQLMSRSGGPGPGDSGRSSSRERDPQREAAAAEAAAENWFRRLDQDGNGVLDHDELSEALSVERSTWDKNGDGVIDLAEYKEYFKARMAQRQNERDGNPDGLQLPGEERKSMVYRVGNLPKDTPTWFYQLDKDEDAQIGLYEWKTMGWSIAEFEKRDRNNDGFLTIDEVIRYENLLRENPGSLTSRQGSGEDGGRGTPGGPGSSSKYGSKGGSTPGSSRMPYPSPGSSGKDKGSSKSGSDSSRDKSGSSKSGSDSSKDDKSKSKTGR